MACKNCAAMPSPLTPFAPSLLTRRLAVATLAAASLLVAGSLAWAAKADRDKPWIILSDQGGDLEMLTQRTRLSGNVSISRGSTQLRAESVAVKQTDDGSLQAWANGAAGKPVSFRQARDVPGESIEGVAEQLEYDSRSDTVRFIGAATVRQLRGSTVIKEVTGALLVYDNRSEKLSIEGGQASPNPKGRVRMTLMPENASAPAAAASGAALQAVPPVPRNPS